MTLPLLRVEGAPYEQGLAHGRELKDRVNHNLSVYFNRFEKEVGLSEAEVMACAVPFVNAIQLQNPDYYQGMKGIAEGAGVSLEALTALNVRYEILYYHYGVNAMADGCTAFAVQPEAAENGHLWIGQNWDWIPEVQGAIIHTFDSDGFETIAFTECGIFGGKIGLNAAGVGLAINGMTSTDDNWTKLHKPFHVRCYEILKARDFESATRVVLDEDRVCAANYLIACTHDHVVDIEAAPTKVNLVTCENGRQAHANHFIDPDGLGIVEPPMDNRPHSQERHRRMTELLNSKDKLTFEDLKTFLLDKENYPYSINRHKDMDLPPEERFITVTSVIMDLHAGEIYLTDGPPDESEYQLVHLKHMGAVPH